MYFDGILLMESIYKNFKRRLDFCFFVTSPFFLIIIKRAICVCKSCCIGVAIESKGDKKTRRKRRRIRSKCKSPKMLGNVCPYEGN